MHIAANSGPRLMVGVPAGSLVPLIPPPDQYSPTVGVELTPGLGISLDGKVLLVGQKGTEESLELIGHLPDGTYPQRDFRIRHAGDRTTVDGYYARQDFSLTRSGASLSVAGVNDRESFSAEGLNVSSLYPARTWQVTMGERHAEVRSKDPLGARYLLLADQPNETRVYSTLATQDFTVRHHDDGRITVDGQAPHQDFTLTPTADGLVVQGHYPQQHYVLRGSTR